VAVVAPVRPKVNALYDNGKAGDLPANRGLGPSRKPDSALSRHPSPRASPRAPWRSRAYQSRRTIWLARTGVYLAGPSRDTAGGLLPHPFTHHLCPVGPSAGLLSVALDVAAGLRRAAPRVVGPSGLCCESGLCSEPRVRARDPAAGRTAQTLVDYTLVGQALGSRRRARAREPLRLSSTILVGVRRSSTLSVSLQRFSQRGSSPTAGSNQIPGPSPSTAPS
jgi:hypothetical protein